MLPWNLWRDEELWCWMRCFFQNLSQSEQLVCCWFAWLKFCLVILCYRLCRVKGGCAVLWRKLYTLNSVSRCLDNSCNQVYHLSGHSTPSVQVVSCRSKSARTSRWVHSPGLVHRKVTRRYERYWDNATAFENTNEFNERQPKVDEQTAGWKGGTSE
jgi:hypothetical protein